MGRITYSNEPEFSLPCVISKEHITDNFDCGNFILNNWLKRYAIPNMQANSARTFVVCRKNIVIGFYTLAVGSIEHISASKRVKKELARHPIPVMILARLAVDRKFQGKNIGSGLLKDALLRTLQASNFAGIRAIFVHAKDEKARKFYERFEFESSPIDPMKLMLLIKDAKKSVSSAR